MSEKWDTGKENRHATLIHLQMFVGEKFAQKVHRQVISQGRAANDHVLTMAAVTGRV